MSAINITKNLVQHSRTKHIEVRHHSFEIMLKKVMFAWNLFR